MDSVRAVAIVRDFLDGHLHGKASPFLFVGSGLGRRYANLDDWASLLRHFANETERPYEYYLSSADGDFPRLASQMSGAFHEAWWSKRKFTTSRTLWRAHATGPHSALKIEVARRVENAVQALPKTGPLADELALLREAVIDGIITTNYDPLLEHLFPDFAVFVGQDQMLFSSPQGVGEIYKIHGSYEDPNSIVLTSEDYAEFNSRNAYLAAKLLTTFVEHPVIFLGYALGDDNVQAVLRSIVACLTERNVHELRDRLVFVQWDTHCEPSVTNHSLMIDDFMLNMKRLQVRDFTEVFEALADLSRTFPAGLLRKLKEHVYTLVLTDDPKGRLAVSDIGEVDDSASVDVVFGIGMKQKLGHTGNVGLTRMDLVEDVVSDGTELDAQMVVQQALPRIARSPGNFPTFKYLKQTGCLTKGGKFRKNVTLDAKIVAMAEKHRDGDPASAWHAAHAPSRLAGVNSFAQLAAQSDTDALNFGMCMPAAQVDPADLRAFLKRIGPGTPGKWASTQYVKLVCFLDWLESGR